MARLGPFEAEPRIAVAVSGGGDSMALLHLVHEWTEALGGQTIAMTVDHGLRPEASDEAQAVASWSKSIGCAHVSLVWQDPPVGGTGLQEKARDERYRLLDEACREHGILHLAVAQHRDDQAETILLRLAQGTGVDGLAGMAPIVELTNVRLLRPVLDCAAAELKATCLARNQAWIEDPSNLSPHYARARLRGDRDVLARHGLNATALEQTALRMADIRALLEWETAWFLARYAVLTQDGTAVVDIRALRALPLERQKRVLGELTRAIGGLDYLPRAAKLHTVCAAIAQPNFTRITLGHCLMQCRKANLRIHRETRDAQDAGRDSPFLATRAAAKGIFAIV